MSNRSTDKKYGRKALILTLVSLGAKVLGALYRIPLTNVIGAEGVGLYQLIFSIYALALALTSAFSSTLISRQVSAYLAVGDGAGARGFFVTAMAESLISASFIGAALFLFGERIASLQGAVGGGVGYRVIAPAVVFVAMLSSLKGWFNGNMDLLPGTLAILLEQGVKLTFGLLLAYLFRGNGVAAACAAALAGVTIAEGVATLTIAILYRVKVKEKSRTRISFRRVLKEGVALRLSGLILPLSVFVDGLIIVRLLMRYGLSSAESVASYGIYAGAVNSLVNFPVVLVISLAVAVLPLISRGRAAHDIDTIKEKASLTLKLTLVIAFPAALALILLAPKVIALIYPVFSAEEVEEAVVLLRVGAGSVIFLSLTQIYSSLLQAIGRADVAAESLGTAILVRLMLVVTLVPALGILGLALATLIGYALSTLLTLLKWWQFTGKSENAVKTLALITASSGIMVMAILAPVLLVGNALLSVVLSALVGVTVYFVAVLKLKVFSLRELEAMPLSSLTTKIGR